MINDEIMTGNGFKRMRGRNFAKKTGDIIILAQDMGEKAVFTVWGESPTVDFGDEIARYIKGISGNMDYISSDYEKSRLSVHCDLSDGKNTAEKIKSAVDIIEKVKEKYDLVSVCSECGRRGPVEILCNESGAKTICGVCSSEHELQEKHDRIKQGYQQRQNSSRVLGIFDKNTLVICLFAGLLPGILGGLVCFTIMVLGFYVPQFYLFIWIPTSLCGFYTMKKVNKADHMPLIIRFLISTLVFLFILAAICLIGIFIISKITSTAPLYLNMGLFETFMVIAAIAGYIIGAVSSFATEADL